MGETSPNKHAENEYRGVAVTFPDMIIRRPGQPPQE